MKKKISKIGILAMFFSIASFSNIFADMQLEYDGKIHNYTATPVTLEVNNKVLEDLTMPPVIIDNRTLVPASEVFKAMGAVVDWKPITKEVFIGHDGNLIVLKIDDRNVIINGKTVKADVAPKIINNKTMIPIAFVSEGLGFDVEWDGANRVVSVKSGETSVPVETLTPVETPVATPTPVIPTPVPTATPVATPTVSNNTYSTASITAINVTNNSSSYIEIKSTSPIGTFNSFMVEGNRAVIDINNSILKMSGNKMSDPYNNYFNELRYAQNATSPVPITRVAMDLKNGKMPQVYLSSDRTTLYVAFEKNEITNVAFRSDDKFDYIDITGTFAPQASAKVENGIVNIDLGAASFNTLYDMRVNGNFINSLKASNGDKAALHASIINGAQISATKSSNGNTVTYKIGQADTSGIYYDYGQNMIIFNTEDNDLSLSNIKINENLYNKKYTIVTNGDYSSEYPNEEINVKSNYIDKLSVSTNNGITTITVFVADYVDFLKTSDESYIRLEPRPVKEIYKKIVVIDPGHGGKDGGTSGNGLTEKNLNIDIALRAKEKIEKNSDVKVFMTRYDDSFPELASRGVYGTQVGDIFVSLHNNSAGAVKANGTETFYYNDTSNANKTALSNSIAKIFQTNLVNDLGTTNRGVKNEAYIVLKNSQVPGVLLEIAFLSNGSDAALLKTESFRDKAAESIAKSVIQIFSTMNFR